MITLGYNGFSNSASFFGDVYHRKGRDRFRVLGHDAAAALVIDGRVVAAAEEERFSRERKTSAFPVSSIIFCLKQAGIGFQDVDQFAFGWNFDEATRKEELNRITTRVELSESDRGAALHRLHRLHAEVTSAKAILDDFAIHTGHAIEQDKFYPVAHHTAHLMAGVAAWGGLGDAAYIVSDGRGELFSSSAGELRDGQVMEFTEMRVGISDSLAQLYSKVTRYLGFTPNSDEYKVMGLASFRKVAWVKNPLADLISLEEAGCYKLAFRNELMDDQSYYGLFNNLFGSDVSSATFTDKAYVAACVQNVVEVVTEHRVRYLKQRTKADVLLLEGGLALNCVNNARLASTGIFRQVHVSFCASDPGVAIGAAVAAARINQPNASSMHPASPFCGPDYDDEQIQTALRMTNFVWHRLEEDELLAAVTNLLAADAIVGWYQGRMEYGPRALGNRSILADARHPKMQEKLNLRTKKRESFRPFAPAILEEEAHKMFDMGSVTTSPFMTFVYPVREGFETDLAAATHVDGTSRIQTVTRDSNRLFRRLLESVLAATGSPGVLNTSFNVAGEPIVCTPTDALRTFAGTEIDALAMGSYLVTKGPSAGLHHSD